MWSTLMSIETRLTHTRAGHHGPIVTSHTIQTTTQLKRIMNPQMTNTVVKRAMEGNPLVVKPLMKFDVAPM